MLGHNASWYAVKGDHLEVKVIIDQAPSIATWDIGIACIFGLFMDILCCTYVTSENDLCFKRCEVPISVLTVDYPSVVYIFFLLQRSNLPNDHPPMKATSMLTR